MDTGKKLTARDYTIHRFQEDEGLGSPVEDSVALEEPLEIRVEGTSVAVVMRTPGHDLDLVRGFLLTEGIIRSEQDIFEVSECPAQAGSVEEKGNVVDVLLASGVDVDLKALSRHVFTSSSCGICGRATLDRVFQECPRIQSDFRLAASDLLPLPDRLREAQKTFEKTGGLHASGLFDNQGNLIVLREDVGRHNALDKVIGYSLAGGKVPLGKAILLVSGRISFELMQKALIAGIPVVAGISAPSSLAIDCAERAGQTLVGFLRGRAMNVYAHAGRFN